MKWLNRLLGADKDLRKAYNSQRVAPQKNVITLTDLTDFDASIKSLIITRLKTEDQLDDSALEMILGLSPIECLGVPEATILNVVILHTQLSARTSSFESLTFIDEFRQDGIRTSIHPKMEILDYLRLRVHQELYGDSKPPLSHPEWKCSESTFSLLYYLALDVFREFVDSPDSDEFL